MKVHSHDGDTQSGGGPAPSVLPRWARAPGCLFPDNPVLQMRWTDLSDPTSDASARPPETSGVEELADSDFSEDEATEWLEDAEAGDEEWTEEADEASDSQFGEAEPVDALAGPTAALPRVAAMTAQAAPVPPRSATGAVPRVPPPLPREATGAPLLVPSDTVPRPPRPATPPGAIPSSPPAQPPLARVSLSALPVSPAMLPDPVEAPTAPAAAPAAGDAASSELRALVQELMSNEGGAVAASEPPKNRVSKANWFAEIFDEVFLRTLPDSTWKRTQREVQFLIDSLRLPPGAAILDLACGHGRHALELAGRGYDVTGVDLSRAFLERAHRESQRRNLSPRFMVGDMRDAAFEQTFDAVICMNTSFGYFDDVTNYGIVTSMFRSLRPGGRFILETVNRDHIASHVPRRRWWDNAELIIMEEVDFDARTSRLQSMRTIVDEKQRPWEQHISIRLYGAHELCGMLAMAGFQVLELSGDIAHRGSYLGECNRSVILLAQKPIS